MKARSKRPHGEIRQSQVVTTFGPGSMLDLPRYSVLVGGLDEWSLGVGEEIQEARLVEKLRAILELGQLRLQRPPRHDDDPTAARTGITVWQFPEWFATQEIDGGRGRSRQLVHRKALVKGEYHDADRRRHRVIPVRFVRACRRGHIGDLDWHDFVHRGDGTCRRQLSLAEQGTTGDLAGMSVRCECGAVRTLAEAGSKDLHALGKCDGARLWLGPHAREACSEWNRLLIRTASYSYFPQVMSVISIPEADEALHKAVDQVWANFLEYAESVEDVSAERKKKPPVRNALHGFSDADVFACIEARRKGGAPQKPVKQAELETLFSARGELGHDQPDGLFFARALDRKHWESPLLSAIDRVVLVHRLREVTAQLGFTRFEPASPDVNGELQMNVLRAELARDVTWLPAVENRGEGIFLGFKKDAIAAWLERAAVKARGDQLVAGYARWKEDHPKSKRDFFGLPYVMLHSLAHLLITAVSLDCGYPASSIRERIYALEQGYGILLYTGSPDAEGTLGGLIEVGRRIRDHLQHALSLGHLCSSDPVCAQHDPANSHEQGHLLGAACHGCLLIAEPSCEQRNDFLDRALVMPTVDSADAAFFSS